MMTLSSRWSDFSQPARLEIERKLTSTSYPWDNPSRSAEYNDRALVERLRWLAAQGLQFSFDFERTIADLAARLGGKLLDIDDAVEDTQPRVFSLETKSDADDLISLPIPEILSTAAAAEGIDYRTHVRHDPFSGLVERRPIKALAALSYEARNGRIHAEAWGSLLRSKKRSRIPQGCCI
jgi:hypothetical protein